MPAGKLLEDLAENQNCFISTLRDPLKKEKVAGALFQVDPAKYSLEEWDYCISYLIGRRINFLTVEDARGYIKKAVRPVSLL